MSSHATMDGENNQTTFDVNVYFVVPNICESPEECGEDMVDAFNGCSDWGISPEWISEARCLTMKPSKKDVFVMGAFEGETFNKLQNFKCMIIGPRCLLSCFLTGEPIPDGSTPVYNTAMRGIIVSASGFSGAKKSEIQKMVEYMGGVFTKQLRSSVTHLVTEVVMSAKYERAIELGIKIVTFDWVRSVWDTNLKDSLSAKDSIFDKYECPVFLNLIVTSTNLPKKQKEEVKKLINSNGGEFMGVLDGTKVKIVITLKTSSLSEKLKYAMQNNIPCLRIEWVYESVKAGHSLPFNDFIIKSTQACSTPEKSAIQESLNFSTISVIPGDNQNVCIDETLASTMSSTVMNSTAMQEKMSAVSKNNYAVIVENLNVNEAKKAGPFLDGCNIYLTGFSSNQRDKLNKILSVGCATRLDEISDAITHVIVGDPVKATQDLKEIKSKGLQPCILKIDWLVESMKFQAPAHEEHFIFDCKENKPQNGVEAPSPLSKRNLQLLKRPKIPPAPKFEPDITEDKPTEDEHSDIIQQYLQNASLEKNSTGARNQSISERWNDSTRRDKSTSNEEPRDLSSIPVSQESTVATQKILKDLVFTVGGFEEGEYNHVLASIHGLGGKIVGKNFFGVPDFGVVPTLGGKLNLSVKEVVSELFIEDCIDNEKLIDIEYYHRPINVKLDVEPLSDCVIGMSTYSGAERTYLSNLAEALGARYQDTFARKTNLEKKTFSSTHLVCPKPMGEKYNAAVKWKLPAVTSEWLVECAAQMKLVDETPYLVGETMAPERSETTILMNGDGNSTVTPTNVTTDNNSNRKTMNQDQFPEPTSETPVINKRLNNLISERTPQNDKSPFHVNTPDTPYGQVFKENPSPRTRKGWVKWIDHFPDLKVEEPPMKKRRSTPLSEVKRKAWECVVMGRSENEENNETTDKQERMSDDEHDETNEPESSHVTNRKLSFSDESSPNKTPKNPAISLQIAQLDEMLSKASNTPERPSSSAEHSNPYRLEANMPAGNCIVKESQPDSVGWEDPVKRTPRHSVVNEEPNECDEGSDEEAPLEPAKRKSKYKFMFSGIKDKDQAEESIKKLGGEVSNESAFDKTATHLLCFKPSRNEKILSSIASGKWVLHFSYLQACQKEKKFLNEEEYELGNPKSKGIIPSPNNESEKMIMNAAYRWRLKLLKNPGGAFCDIVAILETQKEKRDQFERLINAGGGIVVEAKTPYKDSPIGKKITHCFVQPKQIDQPVDWAMMASKGIMCFPPQYLNDHLMAENPLNPKENVLPEFKKYLSLLPK